MNGRLRHAESAMDMAAMNITSLYIFLGTYKEVIFIAAMSIADSA